MLRSLVERKEEEKTKIELHYAVLLMGVVGRDLVSVLEVWARREKVGNSFPSFHIGGENGGCLGNR